MKTRYEHANGLTTEAELMEYNVPGKTKEYHPLQIGSTYTCDRPPNEFRGFRKVVLSESIRAINDHCFV